MLILPPSVLSRGSGGPLLKEPPRLGGTNAATGEPLFNGGAPHPLVLNREQRREFIRLIGLARSSGHRVAEPRLLPARPDRRKFIGACAAASVAPFVAPAHAGFIDRVLAFFFGNRITKQIAHSIGVAFAAAEKGASRTGLLDWVARMGAVLWAVIAAGDLGLIPEPRQLVAIARERLTAVLDWARGDVLPTTVGLPAVEPDDRLRLIGMDVTAVNSRIVGSGVSEAEARAFPPIQASMTLALAPGQRMNPAIVPIALPLLPAGEFYISAKVTSMDSTGIQVFESAHQGADQLRLVRVA